MLIQMWPHIGGNGRPFGMQSQLLGALTASLYRMCKFLTRRQVDRVADLSMK